MLGRENPKFGFEKYFGEILFYANLINSALSHRNTLQ